MLLKTPSTAWFLAGCDFSLYLMCITDVLKRNALDHRYELKWIRGKCERVANSGVFRSASQIYTNGHMRLPEQIKIQCFKNASQLYMLD